MDFNAPPMLCIGACDSCRLLTISKIYFRDHLAFEAFSSFHRNFRLLRSKSNLEIPHDISNIILIIFRTIDIITNKYCMYPRS